MSELSDRGKAFRAAIAAFIAKRREAKLEKGLKAGLKNFKDDPSTKACFANWLRQARAIRAGVDQIYDYPSWLADAASRAHNLKLATHPIKFTHSGIKGASSVLAVREAFPDRRDIGTHSLELLVEDLAITDAKHLDVYSFLKLDIEGKRLLDWMQAGDADLQAALSDNAEQAHDWMQAFAALVRTDAAAATHPMAKQLYWLTGDEPNNDRDYQLLQPMFASTLAHAVHADIQDARFGEANKAARQAKRDNKPADTGYRDYRSLAIRKLGGTKPQNISQLNSDRGGVNYLLASLPPAAWKPRVGIKLLNMPSVFEDKRGAFNYFEDMRDLVRTLADFLKSDPDATMETRKQREAIEQALGQELAAFGASMRGHEQPGWSRDTDCKLPLCEKLWLDPERSELPPRDEPERPYLKAEDEDFIATYERGDWADEIAARFGLWLNHQLRQRSDKLAALGDAEMRHFARQAVLDVAWPTTLQRRAKAGAA